MWFALLDLYGGDATEQARGQVSAPPFASCVILSHPKPSIPHLKARGQLNLQTLLQNTLR